VINKAADFIKAALLFLMGYTKEAKAKFRIKKSTALSGATRVYNLVNKRDCRKNL
jgi:hypothetical protein